MPQPAFWAIPLALLGGVVVLLLRDGRPARLLAVAIGGFCAVWLAGAAIGAPPGPGRAAVAVALAALLVTLGLEARNLARDRGGPCLVQLGMVLLGLLADNVFLTWVGAAGAVSAIDERRPMLAPARAVPLLLGLIGTVLLAVAAGPVSGSGLGVTWSTLLVAAPPRNGPMLGLAFCFLLVGYGSVAGLVPLHRGAAAAAPVASVGLFALLRLRDVMAAHPGALDPGPPLLVLGVLSVLAAGIAVWRRDESGDFLAWVGIGQAGLAAASLGFGLPFAALLQIILRMLSLQAATLALARRRIAMTAALASCAAIPPFGPFGAAFLIVAGGLARLPLAVLPLGIGMVGMAGGILARAQPAPEPGGGSDRVTQGAIWLLLGAALLLGLALPGALAGWLGMAA